ncbi:hypothetical protein EDB84DRAFT_1443360 [Lactarius hengduanensis]|nr:hypothetical protein EDB84DRAFT_1443360 [Lactarius hengduanensis]
MSVTNYCLRGCHNQSVKRAGRYRGLLVTHTLAQCWIDFKGSVEVHRALWLWANGYISKERYNAGLAQKKNGILKVLGPDGKCTKTTNFSKEQWEEISDIHTRDIWSVEPEKLRAIEQTLTWLSIRFAVASQLSAG